MNEARIHGLATLLHTVHSSVAQVGVWHRSLLCLTKFSVQVPHLIRQISNASSVADRIIFASKNPEMSFINSNVHDDARQGIASMSSMEARATIMVSMLSELRILFGLNVGFAFFVLYYATFLRTISNVVQQVRSAPQSYSLLYFRLFDTVIRRVCPAFFSLQSPWRLWPRQGPDFLDILHKPRTHIFSTGAIRASPPSLLSKFSRGFLNT